MAPMCAQMKTVHTLKNMANKMFENLLKTVMESIDVSTDVFTVTHLVNDLNVQPGRCGRLMS